MSGNVPDWLRANHKKTSNSKMQGGVQSRPIFHSEHTDSAIVKEMHLHTGAAFLADGGDPTEAQLKQMGIEASDRERAAGGRPGFMEGIRNTVQRFQEGNIDTPGSLAYERYGAGRGRQEYENQKTFAENAKMQGDGMRNASMVMGGKSAVDTGKAEVNATKDISPTPSAEYKEDESMKRKAITGDVSSFPTPSADMRPMGDAVEKKPTRRVSPNPSVSPVRGTSPSAPAGSSGRTVVIPNNPRPPVDNESRPSKPYPIKSSIESERSSKQVPSPESKQEVPKKEEKKYGIGPYKAFATPHKVLSDVLNSDNAKAAKDERARKAKEAQDKKKAQKEKR